MIIKTIKRVGPSPEEFEKNVRFKFISIKDGMRSLGDKSVSYIKDTVRANKKRGIGTGKLEDAIDSVITETSDYIHVGIGDILKMNNQVPYWYLINYGGSVSKYSGEKHWVPGYFDGNIFNYVPGNKEGKMLPSGLTLNAVLPAMNYIEKTTAWLSTVWKIHLSSYSGKVTIKTTK